MLKRIGLGLIFALLTTLCYVVISVCRDSLNLNTTSNKVIVVPQILYGIAYALILPTSLEFTIAQCPHEMRGFWLNCGLQHLELVISLVLMEGICLIAKKKRIVRIHIIIYYEYHYFHNPYYIPDTSQVLQVSSQRK